MTSGNNNVGFGTSTLCNLSTGSYNLGIGYAALYNITSQSNNVGIGYDAGRFISGGTLPNTGSQNSIFIGSNAYPLGANDINEIVIGYQSIGNGSNTTVIGNSSRLNTQLFGNLLLGTSVDDGVDKLQVNGSINTTQYKLSSLNTAPTSSTASGTLGEIRWTSGYVYLCVNTNTWQRAALSTF